MLLLFSDDGHTNKGSADDWNFDADSVTMVRPSKSKESTPPLSNHTPSHYGNQNGGSLLQDGDMNEPDRGEMEEESEDGSRTPVEEIAPQLGIDDTAFVSTGSPTQRNSVVSGSGEEGGKRGSVVSVGSDGGVIVVSEGGKGRGRKGRGGKGRGREGEKEEGEREDGERGEGGRKGRGGKGRGEGGWGEGGRGEGGRGEGERGEEGVLVC